MMMTMRTPFYKNSQTSKESKQQVARGQARGMTLTMKMTKLLMTVMRMETTNIKQVTLPYMILHSIQWMS